MKMTRLLAPTLRENPAEAEVVSHQLLVRAGYIRRLANGVYNYLPLMWRVLRKVDQIVREEMDRAGAQELLMPILQPAEVWQASGRWDIYGDLMMRVKDRHDRWYGLAPTAEEVITDIATKEVRSYRQLPVNLYQIQTKYRDEIRPRFGLLRGREFIMKDAYSFHASQECLEREYESMAATYTRIFNRCGLETRQVRSDSGSIGGSVSHEYMVLTRIAPGEQESGENEVFFCDHCDYAANVERADSILPNKKIMFEGSNNLEPVITDGTDIFSKYKAYEEVETPGTKTIEQLCKQLNCPPTLICKAILYMNEQNEPFIVLIRGDLKAEEIKVLNAVQAQEIRPADEKEIWEHLKTTPGFIGIGDISEFTDKAYAHRDIEYIRKHRQFPTSLNITLQYGTLAELANNSGIPFILDKSVLELKNFVIAGNKKNVHIVNFNWDKSPYFKELLQKNADELQSDLRRANVGDTCAECQQGTLQMTRGIEVGNIFQLGTKYSGSMGATYTAEDGTEQPFIMGCYGIGVTRTAAAAIERFHDKFGIIWPMAIAPYQVVVVPVNVLDETQMNLGVQLYEQLQAADIEVVLDDRDERAGVKFKDADLIGFPIRVTAGKKAVEGLLEVKLRDQDSAQDIPAAEVLAYVQRQIAEWRPFAQAAEPASV